MNLTREMVMKAIEALESGKPKSVAEAAAMLPPPVITATLAEVASVLTIGDLLEIAAKTE